jgi:TolB-like protein
MRNFFKLCLGLALVLSVSACTGPRSTSQAPGTIAPGLIFSSYGAADRLVQNSRVPLDPAKPILVTSLVSIDDFSQSSSLGRLIGEQVASRLVMSGYSVIDVTLRKTLLVQQGAGQFMLSRDVKDISRLNSAQAVAVGTYAIGEEDVFLNLRLIRAGDGRILSAYDFTIKNDRNISSLTPPPVVYINAGN